MTKKRFPFSALVGQEKLKTAYLCNIINPDIGGLLISGPKGTGKTTIVNSVSDITPMKVINLPLSCSEDNLLGTIDIERLLKNGEKIVIPGLLSKAHKNILYIDEVNLLPDHIVDDILDVAASKVNTIEREDVSITQECSFVMVGTMNPEEGDLRPQILDRFPICALVESIVDSEQRQEIIKRNLLYNNNQDKFFELFSDQQNQMIEIIAEAKNKLKKVQISDKILNTISQSCIDLKVDGQRPDMVIAKISITIAAIMNRDEVDENALYLAAELSLIHRTRDGGALNAPNSQEIRNIFEKNFIKSTVANNLTTLYSDNIIIKPLLGAFLKSINNSLNSEEESQKKKN